MTDRSEGGQKRASYGPPRIRILSTKYHDAETGLYYYGYRYYSAEMGRWLSRDPRGEAGSLNLYLFVYNNPLYFVDPFGLNPIESFIVSLSGVLDKSLNAAIESLGWNDPNLATRLQSGVEWQLESSGLYTLDETISSIFQVVYITSIGAEYAAGYALLAGPQGIITGAGGVLLLADAADKTQELFTGRNKFREWVDSMPITDKEKQIILCAKEISVIVIEGAGAASYGSRNVVYRYVGPGEARMAEELKFVPNVDLAGKPKNVFYSPEKYTSASTVEDALRIGSKNPVNPTPTPTHRITVDASKPSWMYGGNVEGGTGTELITRDKLIVIRVDSLGK